MISDQSHDLKSIKIIPFAIFTDNYIWLIINEASKTVAAVDPGEAENLKIFLDKEGLILTDILITHHHFDHIGGIAKLKEYYSLNIYAPKDEDVAYATSKLSEGDECYLSAIGCKFYVMDTPGHTLGHISYYMPGVIFCGDTLFSAGCGRLFEGTPEQMYSTIQKIMNLPDNTAVYCTHEYTSKNLQFANTVEPSNLAVKNKIDEVQNLRNSFLPSIPSTIGDEKAINPFLRCYSSEITAYLENHFGLKLNNEVKVFKYLRKLRDDF